MSWAERAGLTYLPAHGFAESREAKVFPAPRSGFGSLRARYRKADIKVCVPPLLGRHVLYRDWVAAVWLMVWLLGWRGLLWVGAAPLFRGYTG